MPGTLFVVATPIGNLEDISARALRVLREAALIAAEDTRRTSHLLARYAISTPTTSLHEHNEQQKLGSLIDRLNRGDAIALVSDAGTPTVSDPGQRLIREAIEAGIRVEAIPGPSAVLSALAVSGFLADTFTFLGFPPVRSKDRAEWLERLAKVRGAAIFFESPHRVASTLGAILNILGECQCLVGRELTKAHEELVRGPLSEVSRGLSFPRGEYTIVLDMTSVPSQVQRIEIASDQDLLTEIGHVAESSGLSRRRAMALVARKHNRPLNEIYEAIERAKKSAK